MIEESMDLGTVHLQNIHFYLMYISFKIRFLRCNPEIIFPFSKIFIFCIKKAFLCKKASTKTVFLGYGQ